MLNTMIALDQQIFSFIYYVFPHTVLLDTFFSFLSGIGGWGFIWFVLVVALVVFEELKSRRELLMLTIAITLSSFLSDIIIKELVARVRPFGPSSVMVFFSSSSYSFPSGHATAAFAAATVLAFRHRRWAVFYYLLAFLIAFSRVYLGKHYPSDVLGGIFLGIIVGYISVGFTNWLIYFLRKHNIGILPLPK